MSREYLGFTKAEIDEMEKEEDIRAETAHDALDLIEMGILVREKGQAIEAITLFAKAEACASRIKREDLLSKSLQHKIICYKHLHQKGYPGALHEMEFCVKAGLALDINSNEKAVFYLRKGDVLQEQKRYSDSNAAYRTALFRIPVGSSSEPEYLGHYGLSCALAGNITAGKSHVEAALKKLDKVTDLEDWHWLIVRSGLYGHLAQIHKMSWSFRSAYRYTMLYLDDALVLRDKYDKPMRYEQLCQKTPYGHRLVPLFEK